MFAMLKKVEKNWWVVPILAFLCVLACLVLMSVFGGPRLLAAAQPGARKDIYSSLTGSSSGLLGFALAAVAILAAFAPRDTQGADRQKEKKLADARSDIAKCLLVTSLFLVVLLVASTVGIGIDPSHGPGDIAIATTVASAAFASLIGLLISGLGVTLSILERSAIHGGNN